MEHDDDTPDTDKLLEDRITQIEHLLAAYAAPPPLQHEMIVLADKSPNFWESLLRKARRISARLLSAIDDLSAAITGMARPS